jgi:hypothetical protein
MSVLARGSEVVGATVPISEGFVAATQVGRAPRELAVQMIPAYSPQARGHSERNFGTWRSSCGCARFAL